MEQKQGSAREDIIQTIFLGDDDLNVDVVESQHLDFEEVLACIKLGGSVFITCK